MSRLSRRRTLLITCLSVAPLVSGCTPELTRALAGVAVSTLAYATDDPATRSQLTWMGLSLINPAMSGFTGGVVGNFAPPGPVGPGLVPVAPGGPTDPASTPSAELVGGERLEGRDLAQAQALLAAARPMLADGVSPLEALSRAQRETRVVDQRPVAAAYRQLNAEARAQVI